jgi:hypothetical protein
LPKKPKKEYDGNARAEKLALSAARAQLTSDFFTNFISKIEDLNQQWCCQLDKVCRDVRTPSQQSGSMSMLQCA